MKVARIINLEVQNVYGNTWTVIWTVEIGTKTVKNDLTPTGAIGEEYHFRGTFAITSTPNVPINGEDSDDGSIYVWADSSLDGARKIRISLRFTGTHGLSPYAH